ncbi:hypothetical protein BTUL_0015g00580 [Botrytis tulipae]|uniref:Major facilitator superfamily (MFS) profile domain-containing protein n=1 Tax=Botrytis tulipae TaxID=87230 RepID=A0A4Z1F440_9HELO|nr:hypothetical protein BTUL_0015g00580 [Botrytis tulipae]
MSLCKDYYQFFLAQGFLLGIGIVSILLPGFTIAAKYFTTYRGLALGTVVSGSSLGGVIWPIALNELLTEVGFGWAVRIIAFIELLLLIIGIVNAASLFGRIIPGLLADRFGCYDFAVFAAVTSGLVCTCMIKATSVAGITIYFRGNFSLQGVCAAKLVPPTQFGIAMGSVMTFLPIAQVSTHYPPDLNSANSSSGLVGSPINGKILDVWGYLGMSLFSGMMMLSGGLILLAARLQHNSQLLAKA